MEASQEISMYVHTIIKLIPYSPSVLYSEDDNEWFDRYCVDDSGLVYISALLVRFKRSHCASDGRFQSGRVSDGLPPADLFDGRAASRMATD